MGLLEELAGAAVAVEGLKKVDPDANVLEEGIAAFAGYKGTDAIVDHFEEKKEEENSGQ